MSQKDTLWQQLIDEEKLRLSALPLDEQSSMDYFTSGVIENNKVTIEYGLWHEIYQEDVQHSSPKEAQTLSTQLERSFGIPGPQREIHSFVLKASRMLLPGLYRNYLSGFVLDENGKVNAISDSLLYAYD